MKKSIITVMVAACAAFSCTSNSDSNNFLWGYIDPADYALKTTSSAKQCSLTIKPMTAGNASINAIYSKYIYPSTTDTIIYETVGVNDKGWTGGALTGFRLKLYRVVGFPGGAWTLKIINSGIGYSYSVPESAVTITKDSPSVGLCTIRFNSTIQTGVVQTGDFIYAQIYVY